MRRLPLPLPCLLLPPLLLLLPAEVRPWRGGRSGAREAAGGGVCPAAAAGRRTCPCRELPRRRRPPLRGEACGRRGRCAAGARALSRSGSAGAAPGGEGRGGRGARGVARPGGGGPYLGLGGAAGGIPGASASPRRSPPALRRSEPRLAAAWGATGGDVVGVRPCGAAAWFLWGHEAALGKAGTAPVSPLSVVACPPRVAAG